MLRTREPGGTRAGAHTVTTTVSTQGSTTLAVTGTGSETVTDGDVFTVAGVYAVNPQTRESTGSLQQFVVTSAATATAGAYTLTVSPAMYTAGQTLATIDAAYDCATLVSTGAAWIVKNRDIA